ncbi:MAG: hypothetical protein H0V82_01010 [Candidatus Protochlamydia sp.]|nr:hypothetical protein [Candidatus Protochlamydia sp.]
MFRIANTHLLGGNKQAEGKEQIDRLIEAMDTKSTCNISAKIIMGDFNADDTS